MSKLLALLAILFVSTIAITDKEILQQGLNGVFEQNKLADPTTIVPCFDDATAHKTVVFVGQILDKAAKGSISDLLSLKQLVEDFGNSIPEAVKTCLNGNAEFKALGLKYGIDDHTDTDALEKKVIAYVTLHYLQVHKWLGNLNDEWKAGKYYQTGFDGATYGHSIIGVSTFSIEPEASDKEILQQGLNGVFEQNKLADPTTIVPCFDDATAHNTVVFVGQILDKAAKGSISDLLSLKQLVEDFGNSIPEAVKTCLNGNAEFKALGLKYGIDDHTDTDALEKKVIAYVTLHYLQVHKWLGNLNDEWKAGKYYQTGFDGATYGHSIIGVTSEEVMRSLRFY